MNQPPPPAYAGNAAKSPTAKIAENLKKSDLDMRPLRMLFSIKLSFSKSVA